MTWFAGRSSHTANAAGAMSSDPTIAFDGRVTRARGTIASAAASIRIVVPRCTPSIGSSTKPAPRPRTRAPIVFDRYNYARA